MRLLYYISAHGYGHGVRSSVVINALSPMVEVVVRSALPVEFLCSTIRRSFTCEPAEFDCGCVQLDSVKVDVEATLQKYIAIARHNRELLDAEVSWVRKRRIDVIVSDIAPFAFEVARVAGIPSAAVTNFTWYDIYRPYTEEHAWFRETVEEMRQQYALASLCIELTPASDLWYFPLRQRVGPVGRVGNNRGPELRRFLHIDPHVRLGLIYPGSFGMNSINWKGLERFEQWYFLGLYVLPGNPRNYRILKVDHFSYADLVASCDLVVSKLGYVTVAECILNRTPILFLPRENFAEYPFLRRGVEEWGYGVCLSTEQFCSLRWDQALAMVPNRENIPSVATDSALQCARALESLANRYTP